MQKKNIITLLVVSLALVVFAMLALNQQTKTVTNQDAGTLLYPSLSNMVNNVSQITAQQADKKITIKKQDNQWVVVEKDNYPANISKIKQTILMIADFGIVEAKTKKAENHKKLEVDDPTAKSASGSLITLTDEQGKAVADVILGKVTDSSVSANSKAKMYVRKNGNDQVWLVTGELHADPEPIDWLLEEIINVDAKRIKQVSINHPGKQPLVINKEKADAAHFTLASMPKGKALKSEAEADEITKALQGLHLMDVKKAGAEDFAKETTIETVFQTLDGLVLTAQITEQEKDTFVKFTARLDPSLREEPNKEEKSEEKPKADKNPHPPQAQPQSLKDITTVQQEVAELNEKLAAWVFTLAKNKVELLKKVQDDLLKDIK